MDSTVIEISVGHSRHETNWKNIKTTWGQLVKKLSVTHRTHESLKEYHSMNKDRQAEIKDIGGFVGGTITGGRRKKGSVLTRQLITLDVDYADQYFIEDLRTALDYCAWCLYSTHTHTRDKPKYRLIVPLSETISTEQYIPIVRKMAAIVGMDYFDPVSFRPTQLMYWPSTPIDGDYYFEEVKGAVLHPHDILKMFSDWRDASQWDYHPVENKEAEHAIKKQGDPTAKPGIIGAWCRTYNVVDAIETFLSDIYEKGDNDNRYTYKHGTTANGLVIYDDDNFAYSHHGTDPISNKLCNSFDLVRIHKFGLLDEDQDARTPTNKLKSYAAMSDFAASDEIVRKQIVDDRLAKVQEEFKGFTVEIGEPLSPDDPKHPNYEFYQQFKKEGSKGESRIELPSGAIVRVAAEEIPNDDWKKKLEVDKHGTIYPTINNIMLIIENDLKGCFAFNAFENREVVLRSLPWRRISGTDYMLDSDDAGLRHYLERVYGITGVQKIKDAITNVFAKNKFHPVRDYLDSLTWDGVNRVERLLADYFGAEATDYVKLVTRKTFVAAVKRIYEPGCKFDYVLTLVGPQGKKKSMFWDKVAVHWFSDTFNTVEGNKAMEQVQGVWIIEIGELAGLKRSEQETIKNFISRRFDRMRVAYGHRVETFYRQCIFVGSTNNYEFLTDPTGNRRYWAVEIDPIERTKDVAIDLTTEEINLIWAEAVTLYRRGEKVYLDEAGEADAVKVQERHTEVDERTYVIARFLDLLLPDTWQAMNVWQRRQYINGVDDLQPQGTHKRDRVTIHELWTEALGQSEKDMTKYNTRSIHDIMQKMPGWERSNKKIREGEKITRGYVRTNNIIINPLINLDFLN